MNEPEKPVSKPHLNPGQRPMSKLHIAALCASLGLGVDQVPALRELRLTDDVEMTPIPEATRTRVEEETITAAEAKRKRKLDRKKK